MEQVYSDTAPGWKVLACRAGTQGRAQNTIGVRVDKCFATPVIGLSG